MPTEVPRGVNQTPGTKYREGIIGPQAPLSRTLPSWRSLVPVSGAEAVPRTAVSPVPTGFDLEGNSPRSRSLGRDRTFARCEVAQPRVPDLVLPLLRLGPIGPPENQGLAPSGDVAPGGGCESDQPRTNGLLFQHSRCG